MVWAGCDWRLERSKAESLAIHPLPRGFSRWGWGTWKQIYIEEKDDSVMVTPPAAQQPTTNNQRAIGDSAPRRKGALAYRWSRCQLANVILTSLTHFISRIRNRDTPLRVSWGVLAFVVGLGWACLLRKWLTRMYDAVTQLKIWRAVG